MSSVESNNQEEEPGLVAILDDDPKLQDVMTMVLQYAGYRTCVAADKDEFLNRIDTVRPDVIITDVYSPGMNGIEFLKRIKTDSVHSSIPVIFVTGVASEGTKERALEFGAFAWLPKPFIRDNLLQEIQQAFHLADMPVNVVYGIDIGVYHIDQHGEPLSDTTFAWARLDPTKLQGQYELETLNNCQIAVTGKDIFDLVHHIETDLRSGRSIACGFEAPMWSPVPISLEGRRSLFEPRFDAELPNSQWYVQSGAAATVKALVIGKLLWSKVRESGVVFEPTLIEPLAHIANNVFLFEGFVSGDYKSPPQLGLSDDEWDALCTAIAFAGEAGCTTPGFQSYTFGGDVQSGVISHWETIMRSAGFKSDCCNGACKVVALKQITA